MFLGLSNDVESLPYTSLGLSVFYQLKIQEFSYDVSQFIFAFSNWMLRCSKLFRHNVQLKRKLDRCISDFRRKLLKLFLPDKFDSVI